MKTKKADLILSEGVRMVIAVISILLLAYLAFSLYGLFTSKTELAQARSTIEQIIARVEGLNVDETGDYLILSPKKWYVYYFSEEMNSPSACIDKDCLCVCEKKDLIGCDKRGACENIEPGVEIINNENLNYFRINKIPLKLNLNKLDDVVELSIVEEETEDE
tara:strand:- start:3853 stop:4341 length:489 start_codon:yes stop_codon:yes gene_type:complete